MPNPVLAHLKRTSLGRFFKTDVEKEPKRWHTHGTSYIAGSDVVTTNAVRLLPPGESAEPILDPATHSHLPHLPHGAAEIVGAGATGYLAGAGILSSIAVYRQAALDKQKLEGMLHLPALASKDSLFEAGAAKRYLREGIKDAQFEKTWGGAIPAAGSAANLTGIFVPGAAAAGLATVTLTGAKQAAESMKRAVNARRAMKASQRNIHLENQATSETFFKELRDDQIKNTVSWSLFTVGAAILTVTTIGAQAAAIPLTGGAALPIVGTAAVLAGAAATTITNNKLKGNKFTGYDVNHLKDALFNENGEPISEKEVDERLGKAGKTRSVIKHYRHEALKSRPLVKKAEVAAMNLLRSGVSMVTLGLTPQVSRAVKHKARELAAKSIKSTPPIVEARLKTLSAIAEMHAKPENEQPAPATPSLSEIEEVSPAPLSEYERLAEEVKAAALDKAILRQFAKKTLSYDRHQTEDGTWTAKPRFSSKFIKKAQLEDSDMLREQALLLHAEVSAPDPSRRRSLAGRQEGRLLPPELNHMESAPAAQKLITRAIDKELLFTQRNRARKNIAVYAKLGNAFATQREEIARVHSGR